MLKYVVYLAVAALVLWAAWYLIRHVRRQMKGDCGACGGGCAGCGGACARMEKGAAKNAGRNACSAREGNGGGGAAP